MKKVLILFGASSPEHLVSCNSAKEIHENIDKSKYEVFLVGIDLNNNWYEYNDSLEYLKDGTWLDNTVVKLIDNVVSYLKKFDVVFPIIHGSIGEDGTIQGLFNLFDIKYVGSSLLTNAMCLDKGYTKILCDHYNIPQIKYKILTKSDKDGIKTCMTNLNYPVIIKPAHGGSSIGINVANNKKELTKYVKHAFTLDEKIIIEEFKKVIDIECAYLENYKINLSVLGEIKPDSSFYDYDAKYVNETSTLIPADIPEYLQNRIYNIAKKVINIFDIKDLARIDFLYDKENREIYFNEINTMPGFTKISMYSKLWEYDGLSYKNLITRLIEKQ